MTLICFFLATFLLAWWSFLGHCHAERSLTQFECSGGGKAVLVQGFMVHGLIYLPLDAVNLFCTLSGKTDPNHNASTYMIDCGDDVLWVILSVSPPTRQSITTKCVTKGVLGDCGPNRL